MSLVRGLVLVSKGASEPVESSSSESSLELPLESAKLESETVEGIFVSAFLLVAVSQALVNCASGISTGLAATVASMLCESSGEDVEEIPHFSR